MENIQLEKPEIIALIKTFRKKDEHDAKTFIEEIKEKHISKSRKDFENKVISEMKSKTKDEFLSWWNDLLIFKNDRPINTTEEIFKASPSLFEKYRLSNQKNHLHNMKKHKEKFLYILGQKDETYVKLSSKLIKPSGIKVREINSGHRAFQHADELLDILLDENIL